MKTTNPDGLITKAQVARKYGVSYQTVTNWENAGTIPQPVARADSFGGGRGNTLYNEAEVAAYRADEAAKGEILTKIWARRQTPQVQALLNAMDSVIKVTS